MMADHGSTLSGMDVRKELPGYAKLVKPTPNSDRGSGAETACGARVQIDGEISLTGHIDDNLHTIVFKDMNVTMPIASIIQAVKKINTLTISEMAAQLRTGRPARWCECTRGKVSISSR